MERRRSLPSWMSKKEKVEREPLKRCRKRKVAKTVFYCMNEKELVEAAVSYLTSSACEDVTPPVDHQVENKAGEATVTNREQPASLKTNLKPVTEDSDEDTSSCRDDLETTYVSETDMDITAVETLPYTEKSLMHQRRKNPTPGADTEGRNAVKGAEVEAEKKEEVPQTKAEALEEDEALKLVREIFFKR